MDAATKCAILNEMYRIHETYISGLKPVCRIRCADCCTRNVTITTVEGTNIAGQLAGQLKHEVLQRLRAAKSEKRFRPLITVNGMADRCAAGEELPDEQLDPGAGPCPLLVDEQCLIYGMRPFECRSFVSRTVCREAGHADMTSATVNVNNLLRQYIEHIDADGASGNLSDVLLKCLDGDGDRLIRNRPISVLMIDPEHKALLESIMEKLNTIRV